MASDCTVKIDEGFINLRVGAIIMKGNKFLMAGNEKSNYLYSVGGRIKFGETAEEAVIREVYEETGVQMEVDRLGFIHENYFYGDCEKKKDKLRSLWCGLRRTVILPIIRSFSGQSFPVRNRMCSILLRMSGGVRASETDILDNNKKV